MEEINKPAIITAIDNNSITLKIQECSACAQCSIKSLCNGAETKEQNIIISTTETEKYTIGEEVNLQIDAIQGLKAVFYGYVFPLILLLSVVIGVFMFGGNDFISGISGIIVLIPYYFGLFLLKDKIGSDFQFKILKKK